jgi:hypothetical protein
MGQEVTAELGEPQEVAVPGITAAAARPSTRLLTRTRVALAGVGVAGIALIGVVRGDADFAFIADLALLLLLLAVVVAVVETSRIRRAGNMSADGAADVSPRRTRSQRLWSLLAPGVVVIVTAGCAQSWFEPGHLLAGGDENPVTGTAWLGRVFSPWVWSGSNLGAPGANQRLLPWVGVYGLVRTLGGSPVIAQRVWLTLLSVAIALSCYLLLRVLGLRLFSSALGALVYVFNAHSLGEVLNTPYLLAFALVPALTAIVIMTATRRIRVRLGVLLIAATAPIVGYVATNPPLLLMVGLALLLTPFLISWLDGRAAARRAWRLLAIGIPLLLLASAYWLLPYLSSLSAGNLAQLAAPTRLVWDEARDTIANAFWLNDTWAWNTTYYPFSPAYSQLPLELTKFALPVCAFGFLVLTRVSATTATPHEIRRQRLGIAAAGVTLFFILLSTGTRFPGSLIFDGLYRLPYGWLLQEPDRFLFMAALGLAVLLGLTAEVIVERVQHAQLRSALRQPMALRFGAFGVAAILGLLVFSPAYPLVTGAVIPGARPSLPSERVAVPSYWNALATYLNGSSPQGDLLMLPVGTFYQMTYDWGYHGQDAFITDLIDRPVLDPAAEGYAPASAQLLTTVKLVQQSLLDGQRSLAVRALEALGTPEVVVRGDVTGPGHVASTARLDAALAADSAFQLLDSFGPLEVYRLRSRPASVTRFATDASSPPDPIDLSLLPIGTQIVTGAAQKGVPALVDLGPVGTWRSVGNSFKSQLSAPAGWDYAVRVISPDGAPVPSAVRSEFTIQTLGSPNEPKAVVTFTGSPSLSDHVVVVATPTTGSPVRLFQNDDSYSSHWQGPPTKHVLVDGLRNGWLVSNHELSYTSTYRQSLLIRFAPLLSLLTAGAMLLLLLSIARPLAARRRAGRTPPHPREGQVGEL